MLIFFPANYFKKKFTNLYLRLFVHTSLECENAEIKTLNVFGFLDIIPIEGLS